MKLVAAIDQGTTSTRCMIVAPGRVLATAQIEHAQIRPHPGWVQHDAMEIWNHASAVVEQAIGQAAIKPRDIEAIGITNQRETTLMWDRTTAEPLTPAIVWNDLRTRELLAAMSSAVSAQRLAEITGLRVSTYFSAPKIRWLFDHTPDLYRRARAGDLCIGTIDSWLLFRLTGQHLTDVTNASRTLLMNLQTLDWDDELLAAFDIPRESLPAIQPSVSPTGFGTTLGNGPFAPNTPITAVLGDQQAALVGQGCLEEGDCKVTYGTGCFMLLNTGRHCDPPPAGLLRTVAYQLHQRAPVYALEGSVAVAGTLVHWLRDNLRLIQDSSQIEALARGTPDNGGVYFVPAFSGLFTPHWDETARGLIIGLSSQSNASHIARSALESVAYQVRDVLDAMRSGAQIGLKALKVDGGMVANELLMQFQADLLGATLHKPANPETTVIGAACAASVGAGLEPDLASASARWLYDRIWQPDPDSRPRMDELYAGWQRAISRARGWVPTGVSA